MKLASIPETISYSLPVQPKLSGMPGGFIDFTPESDTNELSSVNVFKQKFIYQASLKSAEDVEREQEKKYTISNNLYASPIILYWCDPTQDIAT